MPSIVQQATLRVPMPIAPLRVPMPTAPVGTTVFAIPGGRDRYVVYLNMSGDDNTCLGMATERDLAFLN